MKIAKTIGLLWLFILLSTGLALAQPPGDIAAKMKQADADLDGMAQEISKLLTQPGFRGYLRSEIAKSKNREHILVLEKFLNRASKQKGMPPGLAKLKDSAQKAKGRFRASGIMGDLARYDLYIPVEAHRAKWKGGKDFLVAFSPVEDEKYVKQIIAYSVRDGKRVILDPNRAPEKVVLVVAPCEHETHEVKAPPQPEKKEPLPAPVSREDAERKMKKPTGKEPQNAEGNSYFQLRYTKIYKDHEPWTKGDPEIYVIYAHGRYGQADVHKVNLSWVNKENRYYWTGSSGYLYFKFDSTYTNQSYVAVWESDGPSWWNFGADVLFSFWYPKHDCSVSGVSCKYQVYGHDDYVGGARFYKSWYPWGYQEDGMYAKYDAYFKVAKWH